MNMSVLCFSHVSDDDHAVWLRKPYHLHNFETICHWKLLMHIDKKRELFYWMRKSDISLSVGWHLSLWQSVGNQVAPRTTFFYFIFLWFSRKKKIFNRKLLIWAIWRRTDTFVVSHGLSWPAPLFLFSYLFVFETPFWNKFVNTQNQPHFWYRRLCLLQLSSHRCLVSIISP